MTFIIVLLSQPTLSNQPLGIEWLSWLASGSKLELYFTHGFLKNDQNDEFECFLVVCNVVFPIFDAVLAFCFSVNFRFSYKVEKMRTNRKTKSQNGVKSRKTKNYVSGDQKNSNPSFWYVLLVFQRHHVYGTTLSLTPDIIKLLTESHTKLIIAI